MFVYSSSILNNCTQNVEISTQYLESARSLQILAKES